MRDEGEEEEGCVDRFTMAKRARERRERGSIVSYLIMDRSPPPSSALLSSAARRMPSIVTRRPGQRAGCHRR